MIASTSAKATKAPTQSQLPPMQFLQGGGNLQDYRFTSGQFAGMTVSEVRNYMSNYANQVNQLNGQKKPDTVTGSSSTDQALGTVAGLGASVGGAYLASGGLSSGAVPAVPSLVGASYAGTGATAGGTAVTGGTVAGTGATAGATGAGATGAGSGAGAGAGAGLGASAALAVPLVATPAWAYSMNEAVPRAYNEGQGQTVTGGLMEGVKPSKGTDYMAYAADPFFTPQILGAVGAIGSIFGSDKAGEKKERKEARLRFQNAGLMNADSRSNYNLADGSQFDIRTDPEKDAYNVDWSGEDNGRGQRVGWTNALTNALVGGNQRIREQGSGELYNAYNSNGQFDANIRAAYDKAGGRDAVYGAVAERWKKAKERGDDTYTADQRDADFASIDALYGIENKTGARWEDSANLSDKEKQRNADQLAKANGNKPQAPAQVSPQASSGAVQLHPQGVNRNGGRPATAVNVNYRPGADKNPKFKGKK